MNQSIMDIVKNSEQKLSQDTNIEAGSSEFRLVGFGLAVKNPKLVKSSFEL